MIKKILVANRGEIAIRIIRTCKNMGIKVVSIYSKEDKNSLHVFMADECVCTEGYMNINNIIQAAINTKCDAIHCGYGFLSESYEFAKKVEESGLILIGTTSNFLKKFENKYLLKEKIKQLKIPVVDSYELEEVEERDFPILIKSVYGAGGKGIKKAERINDLEKICNQFIKESEITNENSDFYLEKYIRAYRHIEVQFAVDKFKNVIIFPERDCSIQKDYKKIIEITPSADIDEKVLNKIIEDTKKIASNLDYISIGTAEFIVDYNGNYYFIEINPRIQVEHTITEMITNMDLIQLQIEIADGNSINKYNILGKKKIKSYAIEARINALDSHKEITFFNLPLGDNIRLESCIYNGMIVSTNYDPLLLKIICKGRTKIEAINRMKLALEELIIEGVKTNIESVYDIITNDKFINGEYDLEFIKELEYE